MQNYYQFIMPRLNGRDIKKGFKRLASLVDKGIAGFIIFGGELEEVRMHIIKLQERAELPLVIASDLEQGLGQQIRGGTLFPPAMALGSAVTGPGFRTRNDALRTMRSVFGAVAGEAAYAGINTIFAPVLDINTNPLNPIISVRAYGEDRETVSFFGCEMISVLQEHGIAACGKHFPGHGDTETDSHIGLPTVNRDMAGLKRNELYPFERAVKAGVKMLMVGHLSVPAIDRSGAPASVSGKVVKFLREKMDYSGVLITDAMNMGALGTFSEEEASAEALRNGIDIILHPTDPEKIVSYLSHKRAEFGTERLRQFRSGLMRFPSEDVPDFAANSGLSRLMAIKAVKASGKFRTKGNPFLVILNDEEGVRGRTFVRNLRKKFGGMKLKTLKRGSRVQVPDVPDGSFVIVAVFSETRAWKGGASSWIIRKISELRGNAGLFVCFGNPYLVREEIIGPGTPKVIAFWDSDPAQEASASLISAEF